MTIRLLNLGKVSYLHSQTIYHAVAHAMDESSPDTITLMTPDRPYVCIGYHQDAARDVDLGFCRARSLRAPPAGPFQQLGRGAELVAPNDIQVAGRKIAGSGAGTVGDALVVGGS